VPGGSCGLAVRCRSRRPSSPTTRPSASRCGCPSKRTPVSWPSRYTDRTAHSSFQPFQSHALLRHNSHARQREPTAHTCSALARPTVVTVLDCSGALGPSLQDRCESRGSPRRTSGLATGLQRRCRGFLCGLAVRCRSKHPSPLPVTRPSASRYGRPSKRTPVVSWPSRYTDRIAHSSFSTQSRALLRHNREQPRPIVRAHSTQQRSHTLHRP
jgi:hypothetical protein